MVIKTQYRVIILMLALLATAGIGLIVLSRSERSHAQVLYQEIVDERSRLFTAVYRLDGEPQASLASDYTYWDDMVSFTKNPATPANQKFAHENLDTALATYQVDNIWVFNATAKPIYKVARDNTSIDLPLSAAQIQAAFIKQPLAHFFIRSSEGLIELRGATIHPSDDPQRHSPEAGYFFVGRVYDLAFRQNLGSDLKAQVDLAPQAPQQLPDPATGSVILSKALTGPSGETLSYLQVTSDAPSIRDIYQLSSKRLQNFVVIVVPALLLLFWFLIHYVTEPLNVISGTLTSHDPTSLEDLESKRTDFGQIAALLGDYFRQNRIQLSDAHARLRASINSINIGFIMTDVNLEVTMVNDAARRILFDDPRRSREVTLAEIDQKLPLLKLTQTVKAAMLAIAPHGLGETQLDDKFLRLFVAPVTEVATKAPVLGCIILVEDITLERTLTRGRDEFFSIASHELRTPLTVIMGNAAMINEEIVPKQKDPALGDMTKDIFDSSQRLIQMVNDFLDTSRLEQGRIKFDLKTFDLVKVLKEIVSEYSHIASEQGITLLYERVKPKTGPVRVRADLAKLQQVLINLLSNAVTFTHKGTIRLQLESHPEYARIFVVDTGEGIPSERHSLLFKKFQQAEANILSRNPTRSLLPGTARDTTHGTGLGLYISKMLIEGMGGMIRLESSEVGRGTTFSLTLPTADSSKLKTGDGDGQKTTLN